MDERSQNVNFLWKNILAGNLRDPQQKSTLDLKHLRKAYMIGTQMGNVYINRLNVNNQPNQLKFSSKLVIRSFVNIFLGAGRGGWGLTSLDIFYDLVSFLL